MESILTGNLLMLISNMFEYLHNNPGLLIKLGFNATVLSKEETDDETSKKQAATTSNANSVRLERKE